MKTSKINMLLPLMLPLFTTSCYQDIDLDGYREQNGENLLTINSIINPDSTISVAATRTYFFSDIHNERSYIEDLDIELYLNGKSVGEMTFDKTSYMYISDLST